MTERGKSILVRLSEEEFQTLTEDVAKTSFTREGYIRLLIKGYHPMPIPPMRYYDLIRQARDIGIAIAKPDADRSTLKAKAKELSYVCDELQDMFIPQKAES